MGSSLIGDLLNNGSSSRCLSGRQQLRMMINGHESQFEFASDARARALFAILWFTIWTEDFILFFHQEKKTQLVEEEEEEW